ncbi:MAG: hypothetical protein JSW60_04035 [Thermoplasmatales archaeon]|nr:MAG: hypothetical protein JSW60_04035 [Thermoplasmatales archaeon]
MKANRKWIENNEAVSSFLSVMIFAAITVLLVVIVWIFHAGIFSEAPQKLIPSIGMIQDGDHILITSVHNGPVTTKSALAEIINKSSGTPVGNASINDGGDDEINVGDSIALTGATKGAYTVSLFYEGIVVGHCQYTMYKD